jgi:hypothetical protein
MSRPIIHNREDPMTAPKYSAHGDGGQYLGEQIQLIYHRMR